MWVLGQWYVRITSKLEQSLQDGRICAITFSIRHSMHFCLFLFSWFTHPFSLPRPSFRAGHLSDAPLHEASSSHHCHSPGLHVSGEWMHTLHNGAHSYHLAMVNLLLILAIQSGIDFVDTCFMLRVLAQYQRVKRCFYILCGVHPFGLTWETSGKFTAVGTFNGNLNQCSLCRALEKLVMWYFGLLSDV